MPRVELQIGALPSHVRTARLIAAALGRRIGLDAVVIDEVKLAVGEACARAVNVHRAAGVREPIVIDFRDDDSILEILVQDCGPAGAQLPDTSDSATAVSDASGASPAAAAEAEDLLKTAATVAQQPADQASSVDVASLAPKLGLALIAGLVDDMSVADRPGGTGSIVTMRWPIISLE